MHRHYSYYWRRCRDCGAVAVDCSEYCEHCDRDVPEEPQDADSVPEAFPCTCTPRFASSAALEPPEPILDRYCPQHGDGGPDPDAALEAQRERAVQERLERILEAREARHEREHGPRHTSAIQDEPDFPGWADNH